MPSVAPPRTPRLHVRSATDAGNASAASVSRATRRIWDAISHLDTMPPAHHCHALSRSRPPPPIRDSPSMMKRVALLLVVLVTSLASAQERDVMVTGGWLFASTSNARVRNPGILIRAGKILRVGG